MKTEKTNMRRNSSFQILLLIKLWKKKKNHNKFEKKEPGPWSLKTWGGDDVDQNIKDLVY